jgi:hypothetical protein
MFVTRLAAAAGYSSAYVHALTIMTTCAHVLFVLCLTLLAGAGSL